jgi:hypothetical protein
MLLVIPVSEADVKLANPVLALMKAFGPYQHHDLLVVGSTENANDVNRIREALSPMFRKSEAHIFDCPAKGWPLGPNFYFRASILHMFASGLLDQAWYWFELDNTPLKAGWLDALQTEYNLSQAIFMGAKQATYYRDKDDKLVIDGHHMCGTAIYPADFTNRSSLWKFENGIAFDVWIQWEILPHLHDTKLMQHNWKTINYRRERGQIVSDNFDMPHPDLHTNDPIHPDAVVCHGCKDGSLAKLLLDELNGGETADLESDPDDLGGADAVTPRFDTSELVFPKSRKRKKLEEAA